MMTKHTELLEACKEALTNLGYYKDNESDDYKARYLLKINMDKLQQAINKAENKESLVH